MGLGYFLFLRGFTLKGMIFPHILIVRLSVCWIFIALPISSFHDETQNSAQTYMGGFLFPSTYHTMSYAPHATKSKVHKRCTVTCLPLMWKLLTGMIADSSYNYLEDSRYPTNKKDAERDPEGQKINC